ncbi:hypothetical protein Tco_0614720 [Tanacetum coccineum]
MGLSAERLSSIYRWSESNHEVEGQGDDRREYLRWIVAQLEYYIVCLGLKEPTEHGGDVYEGCVEGTLHRGVAVCEDSTSVTEMAEECMDAWTSERIRSGGERVVRDLAASFIGVVILSWDKFGGEEMRRRGGGAEVTKVSYGTAREINKVGSSGIIETTSERELDDKEDMIGTDIEQVIYRGRYLVSLVNRAQEFTVTDIGSLAHWMVIRRCMQITAWMMGGFGEYCLMGGDGLY